MIQRKTHEKKAHKNNGIENIIVKEVTRRHVNNYDFELRDTSKNAIMVCDSWQAFQSWPDIHTTILYTCQQIYQIVNTDRKAMKNLLWLQFVNKILK